MSKPLSISQALLALYNAIETELPGFCPAHLLVTAEDGKGEIKLDLRRMARAASGITPNASRIAQTESDSGELPFVPNTFQKAVLKALDGKALKIAALGAVVMDRPRLAKPHGLQELVEQGLVEQHPRLGYYRPDALPAELQEGESTDD